MVDLPKNSSIINSSGWNPWEPITHVNRYRLIQSLISEEVITKREQNIQAFMKGLNLLKVGDLVAAYPDLMKEVFVYKHTNITADQFLALVTSPKPDSPKHAQAFDHFVHFVNHLELEDSQGTEFNIGLG